MTDAEITERLRRVYELLAEVGRLPPVEVPPGAASSVIFDFKTLKMTRLDDTP